MKATSLRITRGDMQCQSPRLTKDHPQPMQTHATPRKIKRKKQEFEIIFSSYISDMPQCINNNDCNDFMDPFNLLQLADDSSILADNLNSPRIKAKKIFDYSESKFLYINETS